MCQDDRFARGTCARHRCRIFNVYVVLQAWAGTPDTQKDAGLPDRCGSAGTVKGRELAEEHNLTAQKGHDETRTHDLCRDRAVTTSTGLPAWHRRLLHSLAFRILRNHEEAEEAVQNCAGHSLLATI